MSINDALIRTLATDQSFQRGQNYYQNDQVVDLIRRGDTLQALVEGSSYEPYQVTITLKNEEFIEADCSCPYDWGGYCKHVVAVLLAYMDPQQRVESKPTVADLLADLNRDQLYELCSQLLADNPGLINWLERYLMSQSFPAEGAATYQRQTKVDPKPFAKQIDQLLSHRNYDDYYGGPSVIYGGMEALLNQIRPFVEASDGANALIILEVIIEPFVERWHEFDYDDELWSIFTSLGELLAEAILTADLSPLERQTWQDRIADWEAEMRDYAIDEDWKPARLAAKQGWNDPVLQQMMAQGTGPDDLPDELVEETLIATRLAILERQNRLTEYLNLAQATGQTTYYVTMLVKLGRVEAAINDPNVTTSAEAFALAQTLEQHGHIAEAIQIGERGLTLEGQRYALAKWLRELAVQHDQSDLALQAARVAFNESFSLLEYQMVEAMAGPQWEAIKPELLSQLASAESFQDPNKIDIYLQEGMVDEAITIADKAVFLLFDATRRVVEAAVTHRPEWAIQQAKRQAEEIMNAGRSKYYHNAINWLTQAKAAYQHADRHEEWATYLEGLIDKHYRKYSLRPALEKLR